MQLMLIHRYWHLKQSLLRLNMLYVVNYSIQDHKSQQMISFFIYIKGEQQRFVLTVTFSLNHKCIRFTQFLL